MDDSTLAELATTYKELQNRIKKLEGQAFKIKQKLLKEMDRRKTKGVEFDSGVRISKVTPTYVEYDETRLRRMLGEHWQDAVREVLDKDKLAALVQEGVLSISKLDRASVVKDKAAYPIVTLRGD